ncbi:SRPBCC family protein [bacterium]|nr:SRPBCC family protein [bacterium]MBU1637039.1 SRPBCC family protein [bacterium]MBU1921344.1 SRPBCC family protein [bacterium]
MSLQSIICEIHSKRSRVWTLLTDPKEVAFWAPNVRDLEIEPKGILKIDSVRHFRLDVGGKIETLDTRITHLTDGEMFVESPIGGSMKLQDKAKYMKFIFRLEQVEEDSCSLTLSIDYEMKGLLGKMLEKITIGAFITQYRHWIDRLKTYAETGRPV